MNARAVALGPSDLGGLRAIREYEVANERNHQAPYVLHGDESDRIWRRRLVINTCRRRGKAYEVVP
jgi:hypothetical protein